MIFVSDPKITKIIMNSIKAQTEEFVFSELIYT